MHNCIDMLYDKANKADKQTPWDINIKNILILLKMDDEIVSKDILYHIKTKTNISLRLNRLESIYASGLEHKITKGNNHALKALSFLFSQ